MNDHPIFDTLVDTTYLANSLDRNHIPNLESLKLEIIKNMAIPPEIDVKATKEKPGPTISVWELVPESVRNNIDRFPTNPFLLQLLATHLPKFPGRAYFIIKPLDTLVERLKALRVPDTPQTKAAAAELPKKLRLEFTIEERVSGHTFFDRTDDITCLAEDLNPAEYAGLTDTEIRDQLREELIDNWGDYENDRDYGEADYGDSSDEESEMTGYHIDRDSFDAFIRQVRDFEEGT
jgi:hypothetical protein